MVLMSHSRSIVTTDLNDNRGGLKGECNSLFTSTCWVPTRLLARYSFENIGTVSIFS